MTTTDRWMFNGDVNLEYGGSFIDLSTWQDGYCAAVRVTDLGSGCGFAGAVLIEHVTILGVDDPERIRKALVACGGCSGRKRPERTTPNEWKQCVRHEIADALLFYGYSDPDDGWDSYRSHHTEVVQCENDGPMKFDGWKADKRLRGNDLAGYVRAAHLRD